VKGPEKALPDTGTNLLSRLRKLRDAVFCPSNLGKESSAKPLGLELKVADFVEQFLFRRFMISKPRHRKSLLTFA